MAVSAVAKRHAIRVAEELRRAYGEVQCALNFRLPLELLIATILSAQCTDVRVNIVTASMFRKYRSARDYAEAKLAELEQDIKSTGFYRNKAKNIQQCCRDLVERFGGEVPQSLDELVKLPGVGRKTANVVLGTAFGIASGVVVDTHVTRLSRRLGLTKNIDAVKIERDLIARLPREEWIDFSHLMITHGRRVCVARSPRCEQCALLDICPRVGLPKLGRLPKTAPAKRAQRGARRLTTR